MFGNCSKLSENLACEQATTLNLSLFLWSWGSYIKNGIEVHIKRVVVLTNLEHPLDLTITTIFIPLQNTIGAIKFKSRETLLWITLYLYFLRKTVVPKYCLQVLLLLSRMCFLFTFFLFKKNDKSV